MGVQISLSQIQVRLTIVAPYTRWVRSFGSTHGLEQIPAVARAMGLRVAAGAWIGPEPAAQAANAAEIANLIASAQAGLVDIAIIGSEVLLRGDLPSAQLIAYINQVRQAIPAGIPVTTADTFDQLIAHPEVIAAVDVVLPNIYPYWMGVSIDNAVCTVASAYSQLLGVAGGRPVIISETGWPSGGGTFGNAVPSPEHAALYFSRFVSWASAQRVPYFYFAALDESWKAAYEGAVGAHWGIFDQDGILKPGMQPVFDHQSIDHGCGNLPADPGTVDVDADGNGDALLYHPTTGLWATQRSLPGGGFAGTVGYWSQGFSLASARFNADARSDAFLVDASGHWFRMLNDGAGGFTTQSDGWWWPGWQRSVVDLDGDGLSDVFLWDPVSGTWFECLSAGGTFACVQGWWSPGWEIVPARFNQDARSDFFLFNRGTGQWFVALGASGGGFSYPHTGFWSTDWQISVGDYTGDGASDLLLLRPASGFWFVAAAAPTGFSYTSGFFSIGWAVHPADLDADGAADLFMHNETTGQWFELISNRMGGFGAAGGGFWSAGWTLDRADFNRDGRADLLLYNPGNGQWFQARKTTLGTFAYSGGAWTSGLTAITGPER